MGGQTHALEPDNPDSTRATLELGAHTGGLQKLLSTYETVNTHKICVPKTNKNYLGDVRWRRGYAAGGVVGRGTALQTGRSRVRFLMVLLGIFIDIIVPAAIWPWGRLSF
jgi:hypothetical protein